MGGRQVPPEAFAGSRVRQSRQIPFQKDMSQMVSTYTYTLHAVVLPKDKKITAGTFPAISHWILTVILSISNPNAMYK